MSYRFTTLVLIRHAHIGDNDLNGDARLVGHVDIPLSPRGREQARQLAAALSAGVPPRALYTSPLRRACETAAPIAAAAGLSATRVPELSEIDCGALDGLLISDVRKHYPEIWALNEDRRDPEFRWPGGESYAELRARVRTTLGGLAQRHLGQTIWLVTHAGVISQAVGALRGLSPARWDAFRPGNATVTRIEWGAEGSLELLGFNERITAPALTGAPGSHGG